MPDATLKPETISKELIIPADHPCIAGHFPGNPIVPGVVLLDEMRTLFLQWRPSSRINTLSQIKFHSPLRPEQQFMIMITENDAHSFKFECIHSSEKVASGKFKAEECA